MRKVASFVNGILFGALVGSAIALLFTPWSGEELKQNVNDFTNHFKNEVRQAGIDKRQELESQLAAFRSGKF